MLSESAEIRRCRLRSGIVTSTSALSWTKPQILHLLYHTHRLGLTPLQMPHERSYDDVRYPFTEMALSARIIVQSALSTTLWVQNSESTGSQALQIKLESMCLWQSYASRRGRVMSKVT
jgi:hypothetical protein